MSEIHLERLMARPFQNAVDGRYGSALANEAVEILDHLGQLPLGEVLQVLRLAGRPRGPLAAVLKTCEEALADHAAWQAQNERG